MPAKVLALAVAALLALSGGPADAAPRQKHRAKRATVTAPTVLRDYDGTPVIMNGLPRAAPVELPRRRAKPPPVRPRGSSTYIPQPVPSPNAPNSPPPAVLLQPPPAPVVPPKLNTFQDRVRDCIHSAPLNTGVGNNPANTQAYIGQCAN